MRTVLLPALALATTLAVADDGWLGYPGKPKQFNAKPTVRMASERVTVVIHRWHADVRCEFVFENHGPATTVKMGFPDFHSSGELGKKAITIYDRFNSYVDGVRVRTKLEPKVYQQSMESMSAPAAFQTKSVHFGRHQVRRVNEVYRVSLGSLALSGTTPNAHYPAIKAFDYIFHTGSTWNGPIGKAAMTIAFARDATMPQGSIRLAAIPSSQAWTYEFFSPDRRKVYLSAKGWSISGRTLSLSKSNWKPSRADDVQVVFGLHFRDVEGR